MGSCARNSLGSLVDEERLHSRLAVDDCLGVRQTHLTIELPRFMDVARSNVLPLTRLVPVGSLRVLIPTLHVLPEIGIPKEGREAVWVRPPNALHLTGCALGPAARGAHRCSWSTNRRTFSASFPMPGPVAVQPVN